MSKQEQLSPTESFAVAQIERLSPIVSKIGVAINAASPYIDKGLNFFDVLWLKLQPYHIADLGQAFYGLILVFFGGVFVLVLSAWEALLLTGLERTTAHLRTLYLNFKNIQELNDKDNKLDDDHNGVPDVQEISKRQLLTRKLMLVLKAAHPDDISGFTQLISGALMGLWTIFLTVIAVLRAEFAQTVSLGSAIGSVLSDFLGKHIARVSRYVLPRDLTKYIPIIVRFWTRGLGITLAWLAQRLISALYSSLRGAQLFVHGLLQYAKKNGYSVGVHYDPDLWSESSHLLFSATVGLLAFAGFSFQLWAGLGLALPFPLNLILFPFTALESYLAYAVSQ